MLNSVYKISEPVIKHVIENDKAYIWLFGYSTGALVYAASSMLSARRTFGRMRSGEMVNVNFGNDEYAVIKRTDK